MTSYTITIDTGTTNTRTFLWDNCLRLSASEKRPVGVRNTAIDGNNSRLKGAIHDCLDAMLQTAGIDYSQVGCVIASGMITSNVGLVEIPHLVVPAGIPELAGACRSVLVEDVCPLPIHFIPGLKNSGDAVTFANIEQMDMMRGEEVEACAIIDQYSHNGSLLLVLPGSHTKFVSVNREKQITGCLTTIGGELLSAITNDTIIADAVGHSYVEMDTYDREVLLLGYDTAKKAGLARACFSTRILNQFISRDTAKAASFLMGAVLQSDIQAMQNSGAITLDQNTAIIVAGKDPFQQVLVDILQHENPFCNVVSHTPDKAMPLAAKGACIIAKAGGIL